MAQIEDMSAAEAAATLGITRASLYAYVSRGMIRSRPDPADPRARRYSWEDIQRLKTQQGQRQAAERGAATALSWGMPVLESQLTLIREGQLFYRGHCAIELARSATFEQVAMLLWTDSLPDPAPTFAPLPQDISAGDVAAVERDGLTLLQRFQTALPRLAAADQGSYDMRPAGVVRSGGRIVRLLAALLGGTGTEAPLAVQLQQGLLPSDERAVPLLNTALILCADHELNVSAFTARCVASAGASPYEVVSAGLSALAGVRHGGQTERVEILLREVAHPGEARRVLAERLRRGDPVPGFGHRLYPAGDPRARALLVAIAASYPDLPVVAKAQALSETAQELLGERPTLDFGMAVLAQALGSPPGTALALFALGRTVGWLAHAVEEYQRGS
ncbi:MAG: hypothetical protein MUD01_10800 [Chloroflexaceae bacterium]|nr:hypothetical protein [Chloroflexaceae bacterium]